MTQIKESYQCYSELFLSERYVWPKSKGLFIGRAIYAGSLLAIIATCWLVLTGTQAITSAGDTARFGATLLRTLAPLNLPSLFCAAMTAAVAVSVEERPSYA